MEGMGIRTALQFQANMVHFSRQSGIIDEYWINAHDIGRYVYRFFDGIKLDKESIDKLKQGFADLKSVLPLSTSQLAQLPQLKTPREWSDFIVLNNLSKQWVEWVSQMIDQRGYRFTVDQVVDIARRPGLALLLNQDSYAMNLDIKDDAAFTGFNSSISLARENKTLPRARGVLGQSFNYLPTLVRNALILFRPYLFPKPGPSAAIPDLSTIAVPTPAFSIKAFKTLDGAEVASIPADPEGLHIRDFRLNEARAVTQAITDGNKAVLVTGLSGSGITEGLIWNLEKDLTAKGHRVVSIDIKKVADFIREHKDPAELEKIIRVMNESVQPNIIIIDNALLIERLPNKQLIQILLKKYFSRPDQHIVLLGSGRNSFESQEKKLKSILDPLGIKDPPVVAVHPKPLNLTQAYRFLGLAKITWLSVEEKLNFLNEVFAKIPTYYPLLENLRLSFGPQRTLEEAMELVADDMTPDYWENDMGAIVEETPIQPETNPELTLVGGASVVGHAALLPGLMPAIPKP
ncbi:MAG: hypothetical protein ACD_73C00171G0001 [uncultured bacterium]|nr:MAG: hypothetical protein ACD_73C00171G0001 [uncultured bacterium]